jgi:peroxiredoxin Q/BCP
LATLGGTVLEIGSHAPEFTLPSHDGMELSLTTLLNHGPLLLYFYTADFAPPCLRQAEAIGRIVPQLHRSGLVVAGVGAQSPSSHARFRRQFQLPQVLLADENKAVIRMYDVAGPMGMLVRRVTYLIDQGRIIRGAALADFRIAAHTSFMLEARPRLDAIAAQLRRRNAAA